MTATLDAAVRCVVCRPGDLRVCRAVALLLAAFVLQEMFGLDVDGSLAITMPFSLGATLPLAWRRRAPLAAVAVDRVQAVILAYEAGLAGSR